MRSENLCEAFIFGALAPPTARRFQGSVLKSYYFLKRVFAHSIHPNINKVTWVVATYKTFPTREGTLTRPPNRPPAESGREVHQSACHPPPGPPRAAARDVLQPHRVAETAERSIVA